MSYVQRFLGWCLGMIVVVAVISIAIWVLTHPATAAGYVTGFFGFLFKLGTGLKDLVVNIVTGIASLFT